MATGTTNAISQSSGISTSIRLYYSTSFNAATSTSTVSLIPQTYASVNLGGDIRFYAGGISNAGVYGGATSSTSNLYSLSGNYGSGQYLKANDTSWTNLIPQSGSISTFAVKHGKDGKATFYGGVIGKVITMYDYSTSTYSNKSGCSATITVSAPYSITYNANGGSGAPSSQAVFATYSYNLSSTIPTKSGFNFLGWATSSSATAAEYTPGQSVTISGNLPLYAVWSASSKTVFLSAGANVEEVIGSGTYSSGDTVNCFAIVENDPNYIYTFDGWYNGNTFVSSDNPYSFSMGNDNITLEARASKTKIDLPGISSITTPDGDTYVLKDAYAREAIENLGPGSGIAIQPDEPTNGELVWIDTDDPGTEHIIPEIDDSTTSENDTWSSQKIASQSDMETLSLSWSLLNCSGTIGSTPTVKLSKDGKYLWFSGMRITITSYSRGSGGNPGIKANTSFRPSERIVVYCGVRVDNTTFRPEAVYIQLNTDGELDIRVNESYTNAATTPLHLMMTSCIIPLN